MPEQRLTKSIFLIIYFQLALSLRLYKLNAMSEEVNPRLKEILDTERTQQKPEYRKNSIFFKEKPDYRRTNNILAQPFLGKSTLVSRIIPHGYEGGPYEYDSRLNTVYKPLIRFHVKKRIEDQERDLIKAVTEKPKVLGYIIAVNKGKNTKSDLLMQIKNIIEMNKQNDYNKYMRTDHNVLAQLQDKSKEEFDHRHFHSVTTEKPGHYVVIPEYPFWNYWTYSKTIHQDDCPGSLVKLGNVCIAPSGHRKYNDIVV